MDPDAAIREIRDIAKDFIWSDEGDGYRLAELIDSLDSWISNGGYLPLDWESDVPCCNPDSDCCVEV